jgi:hypothetical protein
MAHTHVRFDTSMVRAGTMHPASSNPSRDIPVAIREMHRGASPSSCTTGMRPKHVTTLQVRRSMPCSLHEG